MYKLSALFIWLTLSLSLNAQIALGPTVSTFAVLGGSTVTNAGPSVITGNLGVSPGTAVTGFPPGGVTAGAVHGADAVALQAQRDVATAYNDAAGRSSTATISADLAGRTLTPGVYTSASSLGLTGDLTLDARGDPNAVFVFQAGSTLTAACMRARISAGSWVAAMTGTANPSAMIAIRRVRGFRIADPFLRA